ncbi:MAG: SRPBCC domain-containing protein [Actinomycetota bacterium]|nr:SRPBCC domain-containing protein [Actinomycetota bacterium]
MTAAEPTPLRRPPIRQSTIVRSDAEHTFDVFVRRIGEWWPVQPYSLGEEKVASVTFEPRVGGRVYETWADGREVTWGHVTAWDPPRGFSMTWEVFSAVTDVELTFRPLGPALTRVAVEHRGWERLSDAECAALTTGPNRYDTGWATVLAAFSATFES